MQPLQLATTTVPPPSPMQLVLEDGSTYSGVGLHATVPVGGEVVFTTAMTGYVEALTDPSYAGQILVFTYPLLGNYGIPRDGAAADWPASMQSNKVQPQGVVTQVLSEHFSHHRAERSLASWLHASDVPIVTGLDTRTLTRKLREHGTLQGWLLPANMHFDPKRDFARTVEMQSEVFQRVAPTETVHYKGGDQRILVVDTGTKSGIIECLLRRGASVVHAPWHANIAALAKSVDAILLTNGPGDPKDLGALTTTVRSLFDSFQGAIFGVCLGHQILARAAGFDTYKLPYGHRGINQPVQDVTTRQCYVTSQNHGYAVEDLRASTEWSPWFVNLNDGTNEGLRSSTKPIRSVQFHPEGRPGPKDCEFLFDEFLKLSGEVRAASRGRR